MKKRILLAAICTIAAATPVCIAAPKPVLPLQPSAFIICLPPPPTGWAMNTSISANNFSGGWITAFAEREFKLPPPRPTPGAPSAPAEPAVLNIHVTDSGYKSDYKSMVQAPKNGGASAAVHYLSINQFPARMLKTDNTTTIVDLVIKDRFLVEIRVKNLPDDQLTKTIASLDFSKLQSVPESGNDIISNPVILSRVDELNSQNNRSYPLYWQSAQ